MWSARAQRALLALAGLAAGGCELVFPADGDSTGRDASGASDAPEPADAMPDAAYPTGMFAAPTVVPFGLMVPRQPSLTADLCEIYVSSLDDLFKATRSEPAAPWSLPALVGELNSPYQEDTPSVSGDGLELHFASVRPGGAGGYDVWVATRTNRADPWSLPILATGINTSYAESGASLSPDGLHAVWESNRPEGTGADFDLYTSTRTMPGATWGPATLFASLVSSSLDAHPVLSPDRRTIYFYSHRTGDHDLYVARRAEPDVVFDPPEPIGELNTPDAESAPWVSPDGHHIFFIRQTPAGIFLMTASR